MNKYLFSISIILLGAVLFLAGVAHNQYLEKKKALAQVKSEQESVYQMQYLNYQKEKEIEQIRQSLENTGLCDIILTQSI